MSETFAQAIYQAGFSSLRGIGDGGVAYPVGDGVGTGRGRSAGPGRAVGAGAAAAGGFATGIAGNFAVDNGASV